MKSVTVTYPANSLTIRWDDDASEDEFMDAVNSAIDDEVSTVKALLMAEVVDELRVIFHKGLTKK